MMNIQTKITMLLLVLFAIGCSKKEDETPVVVESDAKQMTSFIFNAADNATLSDTITVSISEAAKTASSSIPDATDVTALTPTITVSAKATVSPGGAQDFSSPVIYTVTAEDGSTAAYSVSLEKEAPIATVASMSPLSGPKTTIITFTGTNFGEDASVVQVFFDDLEAEIQSVTNTEIKTVVPPRSYSGEVKIMINGTEFTDFTFGYEIVDINVNTFAGSESGFLDGSGTNAQFVGPEGIAKDNAGNFYIADLIRLRKISAEGEVSTLAGSGEQVSADGVGENASFFLIRDVAVDNSGNIYATDRNKIRKITPEGIVSTLAGTDELGFADGIGSNAQFSSPFGIAVDASGTVFVADARNNRIRKITPEGSVTTIAGTGTSGFVNGNSNSAQFDFSTDIALDALGNLYVSENGNDSVRKINSNGIVSTVVGNDSGFADGTGINAQLNAPFGLMIDNSFTIYVADTNNSRIRKITQE